MSKAEKESVQTEADLRVDLNDLNFAGDDAVVPFQVEGLDVRGRAVQLGSSIDAILKRHNYPEPVSRLLAEAMALTVLLGTSLKFEGKFIFQTQSDGPVDMLVVDFSTPHSVRCYARYDADRVQQAVLEGQTSSEELLGRGTLAFTVDQGSYMQRYQGIVALDGSSLEQIARTYFRQSEQIATDVKLSVAKLVERGDDGASVEKWRAGGLMIQFLPESELRAGMPDFHGGDGDESDAAHGPDDDGWTEAQSLVATIESSELTDPQVGVERLLYRLFHERGVRVYEPTRVYDQCSCSRDKIENMLANFSAEEITDSIENGKISVSCEFCSTHYEFDPAEFQK